MQAYILHVYKIITTKMCITLATTKIQKQVSLTKYKVQGVFFSEYSNKAIVYTGKRV